MNTKYIKYTSARACVSTNNYVPTQFFIYFVLYMANKNPFKFFFQYLNLEQS